MNHTFTTTRPSIGRDYLTFGSEALAVHRADERRFADVEQDRITARLGSTMRPSSMRHRIGTSMIWLGKALAGKAAQVPERAAPMREHRLAPTR